MELLDISEAHALELASLSLWQYNDVFEAKVENRRDRQVRFLGDPPSPGRL